VPCPCCGKLHKVSVKSIKESKFVKVGCGATLGSMGLLRRVEEAEKGSGVKGRLYKLD
jgi:hypothetical protein